jgi:glycosyltransferase involved in cell wall biosynthesis
VSKVSAIVCTRNRPGPVAHSVRSLLNADPGDDFELTVIDQSDDAATEIALAPFRSDARFRYHRSSTRGKGKALNEGFRLAKGDIVVCTDDDCEAPRGWVVNMARELEAQPSAALAFCSVVAVPHDRGLGYVPAYDAEDGRSVNSVVAACAGLGLGAAMAVRRDFVLSMGGFDESFGPGGRFPSADEWDLAIRALLSGWSVYETAKLSVLHDGFRTFAEGRLHSRRDWLAIGAVCAKPLRAGRFEGAIVPAWFFVHRAVWPPIMDLLKLRRPQGLRRITAFCEGFAQGLGTTVDRKTLRFSSER